MEEKADLLAMGTAAGSVLIYSTAKGALHCTLVSVTVSGHPDVCTVSYRSGIKRELTFLTGKVYFIRFSKAYVCTWTACNL